MVDERKPIPAGPEEDKPIPPGSKSISAMYGSGQPLVVEKEKVLKDFGIGVSPPPPPKHAFERGEKVYDTEKLLRVVVLKQLVSKKGTLFYRVSNGAESWLQLERNLEKRRDPNEAWRGRKKGKSL
jgi:hypothetical protein